MPLSKVVQSDLHKASIIGANLAKLSEPYEEQMELLGFKVIHDQASSCKPLAGDHWVFRGVKSSQKIKPHGSFPAIKFMESTDTTLHDKEGIEMPSFDEKQQHDEADPESLIENALNHEINERTYLIAASHSARSRKSLGLPTDCLQPGDRLLMTKKHYPGIHSDYTYVSDVQGTYIALHVEDCYLRSANYHHVGAPMLWVIVHPSQKDQLESCIMHSLKILPYCSQFVRHQSILVPPSLLRKWGVKFSICLTKPGDLMLLESGAYHYGKNLGANKKTAINYASCRDWNIPPLYRCCVSRHCPPNLIMPFETWSMDKLRRLDIEDPDEASAKEVLAALAKRYHKPALTSQSRRRLNYSLKQDTQKAEKKPEPYNTYNSVTSTENNDSTNPSSINSDKKPQIKAVLSELCAGTKSGALLRARKHVPGKSHVEQTNSTKSRLETQSVLTVPNNSPIHQPMIDPFQKLRSASSQRPISNHTESVSAIDPHKSFGRTSQDVVKCELPSVKHNDSIRSLVPVANASSFQSHQEPTATDVIQERDTTESSSLAFRPFFPIPVDEIHFLLQWVESNRHIQLKWPGTHIAIDYEKDLSVFDPCHSAARDSWLNDTVIFQLLKYFTDTLLADKSQTAIQILDPLNLRNAIQKKNSALLYLQNNIETFIAPLHISGNHWCLIIVKTKNFEVDIHDSSIEEEARCAAKLITNGIDSTCEWREKISEVSHS